MESSLASLSTGIAAALACFFTDFLRAVVRLPLTACVAPFFFATPWLSAIALRQFCAAMGGTTPAMTREQQRHELGNMDVASGVVGDRHPESNG